MQRLEADRISQEIEDSAMAVDVIMPHLSQTMTEGRVLRWLKSQAESVEKGEPLLEVETDKAVMEVPAPASGVLTTILSAEGEVVPAGQVIGLIAEPGERIQRRDVLRTTEQTSSVSAQKTKASPAAKRLAEEHHVPLSDMSGTGPAGRILAADVLDWVAGRQEEPPAIVTAGKIIPLAGVRKLIAQRMSTSAQTAAHSTLTTDADATELQALRERLNEELAPTWGFKVSYNDLFLRIVAQALHEHPNLNATLAGSEIRLLDSINIGLAMDTERGLVVPVVKDVLSKGLREIASTVRDLVEKARLGKLTLDEMSGGTFTITNLGMYEIDAFTPIINLPECAILGIGRIVPRAVVVQGQLTARPMVVLSLSFDHRLVDGAPAARFLQRAKRLIEKPYLMLA